MKRALLFTGTLFAATPAYAVDKIYTPYVHKGELELEYFGHRSVDGSDAKDDAQVHELSLEYGVDDWWQTEAYGIFQKEPGDHIKFNAVEWENIFQFTKPGEYWADVGASLAYEWTPESDNSDAIEAKLLLAKEVGKTFHILNITGEKAVGTGSGDALEAGISWSSRYRYSPYFEPGFEIHSEFGEVNDIGSFENQEHYIGPVAYGVIPFEMEGKEVEGLEYRLGYLFGTGRAASDGQVVLQLEYEIEF